MVKKIILSIVVIFIGTIIHAQTNYAKLVNPFIGTGGHGHTFPGPVVPFGMVQVGPDTRVDGSWDGCSGYHFDDTTLYGFSHTHLSGTGCSDFGDIMLMPIKSDKPVWDAKTYSSKFDKASEKANVGYYAVKVHNDINVELTSSARVGFHQYTFEEEGTYQIVLDLFHRDKLLEGSITKVGDNAIQGYRRSEAWAKDQYTFFYIEFSKPFEHFDTSKSPLRITFKKSEKYYWIGLGLVFIVLFLIAFYSFKRKRKNAAQLAVNTIGSTKKPSLLIFSIPFVLIFLLVAYLAFNFAQIEGVANMRFSMNKGEKLHVKVAISLVDENGAKQNLLAEVPHWNFDKTIEDAQKLWNEELSKIEVKGGNQAQDTIFYTALYHCFIHPSLANDVDGRYRGRDNKIYTNKEFNYYSVFSLWDTFRALHPLFNSVQRERNKDFIKTFLAQYQQVGRMPMWELASNETDCMIGYHSVSVVADALAKGIDGFDKNSLLEAVKGTAENHPYGAQLFTKNGFLSVEDESQSVSKTLEYAYNHWCVQQIFEHYKESNNLPKGINPNNWQYVFNPKTGFMQPRSNGGWQHPFDPKEVNNNYTEANAWQYTFFVPQDVEGLIKVMGGAANFEAKLTELFETSSQTTGRTQADITGLIGQYAHGNEPSHHMAYLYNYVGKPHLTQQKVYQILTTLYHNAPDGLSGNEDCGQMSAWYVFSAMGFYPVTPGKNSYELGTSLFNEIKIKTGNQLNQLKFNKTSEKQIYVSAKSTNPSFAELTKYADNKEKTTVIDYEFDCSEKPYAPLMRSDSTNKSLLLPIPIIDVKSKSFKDSLMISIYSNFKLEEEAISYEIENSEGEIIKNEPYKAPFYIHETCVIKATLKANGAYGKANAKFVRMTHQWKVKLNNSYNQQYTAGGPEGLIDGLYGETDWHKGAWQGYQGNDFEAVLELEEETTLQEASANFLQDQRAWIMMPKSLSVFTSTDGTNYTLQGTKNSTVAEDFDGPLVQTETLTFDKPVKARFVKMVAKNYGKLPTWHLSAGENAYIFVDEISVK